MQMQLQEDYCKAKPSWSLTASWSWGCCQLWGKASKLVATAGEKWNVSLRDQMSSKRCGEKQDPPKRTGEKCELLVPSNKITETFPLNILMSHFL